MRPSLLAKTLQGYDIVNVGATGILVVRHARSRAAFEVELRRKFPFETDVVICNARELIELRSVEPFAGLTLPESVVAFVSILVEPRGGRFPHMPINLPPSGEWYVRILGHHKRFIFGLYRRHMKTIAYLGKIDAALGARVTTRSWKTILSVVRILES
jgi:hypothetical protein